MADSGVAQLCVILLPPCDILRAVPVSAAQWLKAWATTIPPDRDGTILLAVSPTPPNGMPDEVWSTTLGDLRRFIENV